MNVLIDHQKGIVRTPKQVPGLNQSALSACLAKSFFEISQLWLVGWNVYTKRCSKSLVNCQSVQPVEAHRIVHCCLCSQTTHWWTACRSESQFKERYNHPWDWFPEFNTWVRNNSILRSSAAIMIITRSLTPVDLITPQTGDISININIQKIMWLTIKYKWE